VATPPATVISRSAIVLFLSGVLQGLSRHPLALWMD